MQQTCKQLISNDTNNSICVCLVYTAVVMVMVNTVKMSGAAKKAVLQKFEASILFEDN